MTLHEKPSRIGEIRSILVQRISVLGTFLWPIRLSKFVVVYFGCFGSWVDDPNKKKISTIKVVTIYNFQNLKNCHFSNFEFQF